MIRSFPLCCVFVVAGLIVWPGSVSWSAPKDRVALIIGNGAYANGNALANPTNDADLLAKSLRGAGFDVTVVKDATFAGMEQAVIDFRRAADGAKAAWFYYAGHGIEVKGSNYLIPVDAKVEEEFQVRHKTLALDLILSAMDDAGTPLKVVVLDCCRDNPFGRSWSRSGASGLSQVTNTPTGTIIAFAAAPGSTALDGVGANSPYTEALAAALAKPGLEIDQVFKETGRLVLTATERKQQPWVNSSFYDQFVVVESGEKGPAMSSPQTTSATPANPPVPTGKPDTAPLVPLVLPLERGQRVDAEHLTVNPASFSVGKWPEEMAMAAGGLWVAESGQRTLAKLDPVAGNLIERIPCGRLPVQMISVDETLYAGICTDRVIFRVAPDGSKSPYHNTNSDYPEAMARGFGGIYVLLLIDGSSADAVVLRLDLQSNEVTQSKPLGANASDIVVAGDFLWVARTPFVNDQPSGILSRLDPHSLEVKESYETGLWITDLEESGGTLVGSGGMDENGYVVSFDARTGETIAFSDYSGRPVSCLGTTDRFAVVTDDSGVISVLSVPKMVAQRHLDLGQGPFSPRDILVTDEAIYAAVHRGDENGVVYRVPDWTPAEEVVGDEMSRFLKEESLGGVQLEMSEAEVKRLLGKPSSESEEVFSEAIGIYLSDWVYADLGLTVMMSSERRGDNRVVFRVDAEETSAAKTLGRIGLGMNLEQVRLVYAGFEDHEESPVPEDTSSGDFLYVAGSIYGGVIFAFEQGKVARITLGAIAE